MGKQMTLFDAPSNKKKPFKRRQGKEAKKLQLKCRKLIESNNELNQILAIKQCENVGITKTNLVTFEWKRAFDESKEAIENVCNKAYLEGYTEQYGYYEIFEWNILGIYFVFVDDGSSCTVQYGDFEKLLFEWGEMAIDEFLIDLRKEFNNFIKQNIKLFD